VRVVIGEDEALLREGLALLLTRAGFQVAAAVPDADRLVAASLHFRPEVVVTDIRMPPGNRDDGLTAALRLRPQLPRTGVLVLSQHVSRQYALDLLDSGKAGVGYLLKHRVADTKQFARDVRTVAGGGTVLDPEIAEAAVKRAEAVDEGTARLTPRQREVLALLTRGLSNSAIAEALVITEKSVVEHISRIYSSLGIPATGNEHRRVLAVLRQLSR
jgi:DNA-binding NarL/FixJ family response regulator